MKKSFMLNNKYTGVVLFGLVVLLHAFSLYQQQRSLYRGATGADELIHQTEYQRNIGNVEQNGIVFSRVFGVEPEVIVSDADKLKQPDSLIEMAPRLLAVDEQRGVLTARLWLEKAPDTKLKSVRLDEELLSFRLVRLSLNQAVFERISDELSYSDGTAVAPEDTPQESAASKSETEQASRVFTLHLFHVANDGNS